MTSKTIDFCYTSQAKPILLRIGSFFFFLLFFGGTLPWAGQTGLGPRTASLEACKNKDFLNFPIFRGPDDDDDSHTQDIPPPFQPFAPRKKTRREAQDPHLDNNHRVGTEVLWEVRGLGSSSVVLQETFFVVLQSL